jgi:dimethylhistidine N-methyltransferase
MSELKPAVYQTPYDVSIEQFATDVQYYLALQPRQLPSRYFYDALGSALFDAICHLPWYRITRAEMRLLAAHAREIFDRGVDTIVELGGGNGEKLMTLVQSGRRAPVRPLDLRLIDVSASALAWSARALSVLDAVNIVTYEASYETGLAQARAASKASSRTLALFLGSNIGNFDPPGAAAFLRGIRAALRSGDGLLIGADLVKPEADLLLAYDDPLGVTAAFNRNLLVRINRELQGNFDVNAFAHRALWNAQASRVEMHLVSRGRQHVRVPAAQLEFDIEDGESIWTESSYKYDPAGLRQMVERAGFRTLHQWIDGDDAFALTLVAAV